MSEWKQTRLGEICEINPQTRDRNWPHDEIEYIDISSVGSGCFIDQPKRINKIEAPSRAQRIVKDGDAIVSTVRPNRRSFLYLKNVKPETIASTGFVVLRAKADNDSRFLYYLVTNQEFTDYLVSKAEGSAYPAVNPSVFSNADVLIPDLEEQKAIAKILSAFDDKIELNRRMNATLEAMARALFKAWFVDFEPVHANKENRPSTSASPEIAKLFPSDFENGIPKGWHRRKISECCDVARGASPRPIHDYIGDDIPWVKIADATAAGSFFIFETKERIKASGKDMSVFLKKGSLILSNSATCGIPMFLELDGCIHDGWLYFTNYRGISSDYLFEALARMTERLVGEADGTVQKNLNTGIISRQDIVVPSAKVMSVFENVHMSLFGKIKGNTMENRQISDIRDLLLPRLIAGKLKIGLI